MKDSTRSLLDQVKAEQMPPNARAAFDRLAAALEREDREEKRLRSSARLVERARLLHVLDRVRRAPPSGLSDVERDAFVRGAASVERAIGDVAPEVQAEIDALVERVRG